MPVLDWLLFLGAIVGHVILLVFSLNWWYGAVQNRAVFRPIKVFHGLLVLGGPLAFWEVFHFGWGHALDPKGVLGWRFFLAWYGVCCCFLSFGVLPALTLWRRLRGDPAVLLSNHTLTVDVTSRLGYKPVGRGKYGLLARLPGNEAFQVDLVERVFRQPRLPAAWDGLTILHLSDFHLCGVPDRKYYEQVIDLCRPWEPDLVALTGDYVDSYWHHRWIVPVLGRLRWRLAAFAVLGNHDSWFDPSQVRRRLRRLGIHVLGNTWEEMEVRGEPLVVIGHEGPWFLPEPDLQACPVGPFRLCLSHTPDQIRWARRHGIDLMLAGHNHGGQIRLPWIGSVMVPSRYRRRFDCGTFQEGATVLHVSRGLGGEQPIRYNCRPEVTRIILRK